MPDPVLESWDRHAQQSRNKASEQTRQMDYEAEVHPRRRCLHAHAFTVSVLTVLALLVMGIGQLVGFAFQDEGPVSYALRVYVIALSLLGILVELEWTAIANSKILKFWITRGIFYAFIGVLGLQLNETSTLRDSSRSGDHIALMFPRVAAFIMIATGGLYFLMGITCLQILYNRQLEDYDERKEHAGIVQQAAERYGHNQIHSNAV